MPIRPEHRHAYSKAAGWPETRLRILERARGCCEGCLVPNHAIGYREGARFHEVHGDGEAAEATASGHRLVRIVLTIAHLDQDGHTGRHDDARLRALCQRCHNLLDIDQRSANASHTRALKRADPNQTSLFGEP